MNELKKTEESFSLLKSYASLCKRTKQGLIRCVKKKVSGITLCLILFSAPMNSFSSNVSSHRDFYPNYTKELVSNYKKDNKGSLNYVKLRNFEIPISKTNYANFIWQNTPESNYIPKGSVFRNEMLEYSAYKNENTNPVPPNFVDIRRKVNDILVSLPFSDCFVSFSPFDECLEYDLIFSNDLKLNIGVFSSPEEDDVDFIIYRNNKIFLSDSMSLNMLVEKMNNVISRVEI